MLYALGFIGLFTVGGLTGVFLASLAVDVHVHDTYFVIAHFHYIMVGGMVSAYLGGIHFWWPKISGRMYPETWGKISAMLLFFGFNLTFLPQFFLGYLGMPRRYHSYPPEFQVLHVMSTLGATILAVRLPLAHGLPGVVAALRRKSRFESMASHGARVANAEPAAHAQFRGHTHRERAAVSLLRRRRQFCSARGPERARGARDKYYYNDGWVILWITLWISA